MAGMSGWQDKDDLDLTPEDVSEMFDSGMEVDVRGPAHLPAGAAWVDAIKTYSAGHSELIPPMTQGPRVSAMSR